MRNLWMLAALLLILAETRGVAAQGGKSSAEITGQKPEFGFPFQNVTLEPGFEQFLNCKAKGENPITYKWYNQKGNQITTKDNKQPVFVRNVAGYFDSDLFFKRPSNEHEGTYTCTASNAHGLASKVFLLNVSPPSGQKPAFDFPIQNVTLEPGFQQFLNCKAVGEKPITYKWYNQKEDEIATKDDKQPVYVKNVAGYFDSDLFFKRPSNEHEGSYKCTASNAHGLASKVFLLKVSPPSGLKPEFDFLYQNVTLETGRFQYLRCQAAGEKPITYKWYNEDKDEITGDGQNAFYVKNKELYSDLDFKRMSPEHEGRYTCKASNVNGEASKVFFVRVPPPSGLSPQFDLLLEKVTRKSGTKQYLRCQAEGEKPITYKWYNKEGDEITGDLPKPFYVTKNEVNSDLNFERLSNEHEGPYTCTASNVNGQASKLFFLRTTPSDGNDTGIDKGKEMFGFRDAKVLKYTTKAVTFNISTSGPFKYIEAKYREGKQDNTTIIRLNPVSENIYEIGNLLPSSSYHFQFRTVPPENNEWSRNYNVTLLPDAPEIILKSNCNQSIRLQWIVKTEDRIRGTIDRHQIRYFQVRLMSGDTWTWENCSLTTEIPRCLGSSYTIYGLERTNFYQIEVRAHTKGGYGQPWRQKVYLP